MAGGSREKLTALGGSASKKIGKKIWGEVPHKTVAKGERNDWGGHSGARGVKGRGKNLAPQRPPEVDFVFLDGDWVPHKSSMDL